MRTIRCILKTTRLAVSKRGAVIRWKSRDDLAGRQLRSNSVLFNALRRARIKVPQGPDGRLSSGQYSKLMVGLNRFDQIRVAREARDARIESLEAFEESRRLPDGWKIIGERG